MKLLHLIRFSGRDLCDTSVWPKSLGRLLESRLLLLCSFAPRRESSANRSTDSLEKTPLRCSFFTVELIAVLGVKVKQGKTLIWLFLKIPLWSLPQARHLNLPIPLSPFPIYPYLTLTQLTLLQCTLPQLTISLPTPCSLPNLPYPDQPHPTLP